MTWSYNPSQLAVNAKDAVRLLIGDVVSTDQQMQDEEINYLGTNRGTVYGTAAECCRSLSAKFSRTVDQNSGTSKILYSQMAKAYMAKAFEFEQKAAMMGSGLPYSGGISYSDKQQQELFSDRVQPQFNVGMTDNYLPEPAGSNETIEIFQGTGAPNP